MEVKRRAVGGGLILKDDVHAFFYLGRGILPDRGAVECVVGHFGFELRIIGDGAGHLKHGNGNVALNGQRFSQRHACGVDGLGKGRGRADGFLAVAHLNGDGVVAVQDFLESGSAGRLLKGQGRAAGNAGAGLGGLAVQLFGDGQGVAVGIPDGVLPRKGRVLPPQSCAVRADGRCSVDTDRAIVRDHECRGKNESGANTIGAFAPVEAEGAIGVDVPDVAAIDGVRRARPPNGSGAAIVCNTLAVTAGAVAKVCQPHTVLREIVVVAGRPTNLITRQQEYFRAQAIGAGGKAAAGTSAVLVRDFHLLNSCPDVAVDEVVERSVQVCVDAGILVGVIVAERVRCVDVLHQQLRPGTTRIIGAGIRITLLHNNKIFGRAVDLDFNGAANSLHAEIYICHKNSPPYSKFNPCLFGVPNAGNGQAVQTAECGAERILGHVRAEFEIN